MACTSNLSLLADVAICEQLPSHHPMRIAIAKSLMARELGANAQVHYICMAMTKPGTGVPVIEALRVELLRFKKVYPTAKFSIGFNDQTFACRIPFVCGTKYPVDNLPCITPVWRNRRLVMKDVGNIFDAVCYLDSI